MILLIKYNDSDPSIKSEYIVKLPSLGDTPYVHEVNVADEGEHLFEVCAADWDYMKDLIHNPRLELWNYDKSTPTKITETIDPTTGEITGYSEYPFGSEVQIVRRITGTNVQLTCLEAHVDVPVTAGDPYIGPMGDYSIAYTTDSGKYFQFFGGEPHSFFVPEGGFVVGWALVDSSKTIADLGEVKWNFIKGATSSRQLITFTGDTSKKFWYCYDARLTDPSEYLMDSFSGTWAHTPDTSGKLVNGVACDIQIGNNATTAGEHIFYASTYPHETWKVYANHGTASFSTGTSVTDAYNNTNVPFVTTMSVDVNVYYAYPEGKAPATVAIDDGTLGTATAEADQTIDGVLCKVFKVPVTGITTGATKLIFN